MFETERKIKTKDGDMNTFIVHPDEGENFPIILFLMDAPGKREELHDMARRIASVGYYVMLPNLYYRRVAEFILDGTSTGREVMFEHMHSLSNQMVVEDCRELLEDAKNDKVASKGYVGAVGYCMSGPFVFSAASILNDRLRASASIHGVNLFSENENSPHLNSHRIKGEIYFGCAENDEYAPTDMVEGLKKYLDRQNINHRVEWYPKTGHGFVFPNRAGLYDKLSAEKHWCRLFSLFDRNLKNK